MKPKKRQDIPIRGVLVLLCILVFFILVCLPAGAVGEITVADEISIDPVQDHFKNESFIITGTTNISPGCELLIEIYSLNNTRSIRDVVNSGSAGRITIEQGSAGNNTWSFRVDTSDYKPDEYRIVVSSYQSDIQAVSQFTLYEERHDTNGNNQGGTIIGYSDTTPTPKSAPVLSLSGIPAICLYVFLRQTRCRGSR